MGMDSALCVSGMPFQHWRMSHTTVEATATSSIRGAIPDFAHFAESWIAEKKMEWRLSYLSAVRSILRRHLTPGFGVQPLGNIDRSQVMAYRAELSSRGLSPHTINRIIGILCGILDEASRRFGTTNPAQHLKRLKSRRPQVAPLSFEECMQVMKRVPPCYQHYLCLRLLTGMRSGEINGLRWENVDFERRRIYVRESFSNGRTDCTKNESSQRDIAMSLPVYQALLAQQNRTRHLSAYVFCTRSCTPIDNRNFNRRVWRPLLLELGLKYRRPYQMRHTCATLWLAAGENPEWIARQLGHSTTEMLFRVYSRYVPNLTRQDGSAFDRLLAGALNHGIHTQETPRAQ